MGTGLTQKLKNGKENAYGSDMCNGENREYSEDTLLKQVAGDVQDRFSHEILLATVDGKLQELHKKVKEGTAVEFLTAADKPGIQTYRRSVLLILLKAFYEVVGAEHIRKVSVEYAIANGLFIESDGDFEKTQELVDKIRAKMQEYVAAELPIMKRNVTTDEAIEIFRRHRMFEKERLFHYRRVSRVNLYSIGGFEDYYYGYMVQNTGYLKYFDLILYRDGMMLLLPDQNDRSMWPGSMTGRSCLRCWMRQSAGEDSWRCLRWVLWTM